MRLFKAGLVLIDPPFCSEVNFFSWWRLKLNLGVFFCQCAHVTAAFVGTELSLRLTNQTKLSVKNEQFCL